MLNHQIIRTATIGGLVMIKKDGQFNYDKGDSSLVSIFDVEPNAEIEI